MDCNMSGVCGGCCLRHLSVNDYQNHKLESVKYVLQSITRRDFVFSTPVFIKDGSRRRASLNFRKHKKKILFGFNFFKSKDIADIEDCSLLTPKINKNLGFIRSLLEELCGIPLTKKEKRKITTAYLTEGDVWITEVENGLDVVLEFAGELSLDFRMTIFERLQKNNDIIRISHRASFSDNPETVIEKSKPYIKIADTKVFIPAGTFLQPSKEGEEVLMDLVQRFLGGTSGKIADLFCGVGTFSYPLAKNVQNKITAVDSSKELLSGFQDSINRNMIPNIEILNKNLFKYPLVPDELSLFDAVIFDPPRAGAKEQVKRLSEIPVDKRPRKIIAVSCNPDTFVRDANILIEGGYRLVEVTMVDQFIYSSHSELVALFEP